MAPEHANAHVRLGAALTLAKDYAGAEAVWRDVLTRHPDQVEALTGLGIVLAEAGRHQEALSLHQRSVALIPGDPRNQHRLANAFLAIEDAASAERTARHALSLFPDDPAILLTLATSLSTLGRFSEATEHFRRVLELEPTAVGAFYGLANIGETQGATTDTNVLRAALADTGKTLLERSIAGVALARIREEARDYDDAFESNASAQRLMQDIHRERGRTFEIEGFRRNIDTLIAMFTPKMLADLQRDGDQSDLPVFIVGMPRSGTTLVEQIAISHPKVFGRGETRAIPDLVERLDVEAVANRRERWFPARVRAEGTAHIATLRHLAGEAPRVTDKLPDNVLLLGHIAMLFPRARVVLCRRDPRDVGLSCFFQHFADGMEWTCDLTDIAQRAQEVERLAAHWKRVLPLPILEVGYEDLVADLEGQSRRLIAFLGLDWDPACLSFHTTGREVWTASHWQVRQPVYASSVGKWRRYERHLGPLIDGLTGLLPGI